jgi:hypothetical protein
MRRFINETCQSKWELYRLFCRALSFRCFLSVLPIFPGLNISSRDSMSIRIQKPRKHGNDTIIWEVWKKMLCDSSSLPEVLYSIVPDFPELFGFFTECHHFQYKKCYLFSQYFPFSSHNWEWVATMRVLAIHCRTAGKASIFGATKPLNHDDRSITNWATVPRELQKLICKRKCIEIWKPGVSGYSSQNLSQIPEASNGSPNYQAEDRSDFLGPMLIRLPRYKSFGAHNMTIFCCTSMMLSMVRVLISFRFVAARGCGAKI